MTTQTLTSSEQYMIFYGVFTYSSWSFGNLLVSTEERRPTKGPAVEAVEPNQLCHGNFRTFYDLAFGEQSKRGMK